MNSQRRIVCGSPLAAGPIRRKAKGPIVMPITERETGRGDIRISRHEVRMTLTSEAGLPTS
jgi:hypothetical protein